MTPDACYPSPCDVGHLIEPYRWELPAILALTATLIAADIGDWRAEDTLNIVAPVWLSLALGASVLKMGSGRQQSDLDAAVLVPRGDADLFRPRQHGASLMNSASLVYAQSSYFFLPAGC